MNLRDDQIIRIKPDVLSRVLDGEAVLLDLASGTYFGLDHVGTAIWQMLGQGATIPQLCDHVTNHFEVDHETARRDLEELIADLDRRGLVDIAG